MNTANVISVSGGKDSTASALKAIEDNAENLTFVFADTGHEHPTTYEYVDYLDGVLRQRSGVGITTVQGDFTPDIERKRKYVAEKWPEKGVSQERVDRALEILKPTGIPFLDLCLMKGRFPSTRARFCTTELKHNPIEKQIVDPLMEEYRVVISWQGVRADESRARRDLPQCDVELGQWEPEPSGLLIYRPILDWTADDVFAYQKKHGVMHNPLYEQGMGRVGCMPCIHARKGELHEIAKRFPEQFDRLKEWEDLVSQASKRGDSTFFAANKTPGHVKGTIAENPSEAYGAQAVKEWAKTTRGGRQYDLLAESEEEESSCSSIYGLCE